MRRKVLFYSVGRSDYDRYFPILEKSKPESVLKINGKVLKRAPGTENADLKTGKIEVSIESVEILSNAAQINDSESLVNPQFFPISASPYTAWKKLKIKPKIPLILSSFKKLSKKHELMLVEGMGGTLTPILKNYYITNLIKDMKIPTIIVTRSKVGTVNHTLMTVKMCEKYKIPIKGIIINNFDDDGYPINQLTKDLETLTGVKVLGSIPFINDMSDESLHRIFKKNIDMKSLLK